MEKNEIYDYVRAEHRWLADEYSRIFRRSTEDPGTAGDEGESHWQQIISNWIPEGYSVVTKGRILFPKGDTSPQFDVFVLKPGYPPSLKARKLYLAGGVEFVFECKTTLRKQHIVDAFEKIAALRDLALASKATPREILTPTPAFGILAHSSEWKEPNKVIASALVDHHKHITHPSKMIDVICVADAGTFMAERCADTFRILNTDSGIKAGPPAAMSAYRGPLATLQSQDLALGRLFWYMMRRMAWEQKQLRGIVKHFDAAGLSEGGGPPRWWEHADVLSQAIHTALMTHHTIHLRRHNLVSIEWDEWSGCF